MSTLTDKVMAGEPVRLSVPVGRPFRDRLKELARESGVSLNDLVRECTRRELCRLETRLHYQRREVA